MKTPSLPQLRDRKGRFKKGWTISQKGYPRYTSGPYRNRYVHRVKAALMLGRELTKDEDVHHVNGNKVDFSTRNLSVIGHTQHGYISAKQHFWVTVVLEERMRKWYAEYNLV